MYGPGQDQRAAGQPVATSAEPSVSDQLTQLTRLHQEGALSDEEFAAARSRLLGS
jgi:putative oligomerization/nucleic acid binding protein